MWRVRLLAIGENELLVEVPTAMGHPVSLEGGMPLVGVMSVGQNRWMFHTKTVGAAEGASPFARFQNGVRLQMPRGVERVHRRDFLRISTAELRLPMVQCWPLLDPTTVAPAEVANRSRILELMRSGPGARGEEGADSILLPEVGPPFSARLMNLGGGGLGLVIERGDAAAAERSRLVWVRMNLMPHIPSPLGMTAKIVHTHLDSAQNLYAGVAFEFGYNPSHRDFVVDQITRYVNTVQVLGRAAA